MRMSSHSQALHPMIGIGGKRGKLEQDLNSLEGIARGRHSHGCEDAHSCLPSRTHSFHTSSAKNNFATNESQNPQNRLPVADPIRMQPWLSSLRWRASPLRSKCRISSSQTSTLNLQEYNRGQTYPIHPHWRHVVGKISSENWAQNLKSSAHPLLPIPAQVDPNFCSSLRTRDPDGLIGECEEEVV